MKVAFRTDASLVIGSGHIMRCLTLADALREQGAKCVFLSRDHVGHLHSTVVARGYPLLSLGPVDEVRRTGDASDYSAWLGVDAQRDAADTLARLAGEAVDWLVVDHYGLDARWESTVKSACGRLLVVDDLANRDHAADALLDQNLGKTDGDYLRWVSGSCILMTGPRFALLRPEFMDLRPASLSRRSQGRLRKLLVTMGGVDLDNATGAVLDALSVGQHEVGLKVTVVLGTNAPWRDKVINQAATMPFETEVLVDVKHMAQLMHDSDLAIGAAGSTSWERCCLGLPSLQLVLANNQRPIATALGNVGAAYLLERTDLIADMHRILNQLAADPALLVRMSQAAAAVADGRGAKRVVQFLRERVSA